jgi:hypothetical protein
MLAIFIGFLVLVAVSFVVIRTICKRNKVMSAKNPVVKHTNGYYKDFNWRSTWW